MYKTASDAGFSDGGLAGVERAFQAMPGEALMVVHGGHLVAAWGSTTRRFRQASIRKSYLDLVFGNYVEDGTINMHATLADLDIDDLPGLTSAEKQATVRDLMRARSGVYLPAAYETRGNTERKPPRGSAAPGEVWNYNNWDFNTLVTIFNRQTGKEFFEVFRDEIAQPIGMQDFRMSDTYYRYERDKSEHPAYLFHLSARDMARIGVLVLNEGRWRDAQLIPSAWIRESTRVHTTDVGPAFASRGAYGLLWWILEDVAGQRVVYASGAGGQRIYIVPSLDLVVVHVVDTYQNRSASDHSLQQLLEEVITARMSSPDPTADLVPYQPEPLAELADRIAVNKSDVEQYLGKYHNPFLGELSLQWQDGRMALHTRIGQFDLFAHSRDTFWIEDLHYPVYFRASTEDNQRLAEAQVNAERVMTHVVCYY